MRNKRLLLLSLIMAGLGIALILDQGSSTANNLAVKPPLRSSATSIEGVRRSSTDTSVELLAIRPRPSPSEVRDAFATRNWSPARVETLPLAEPAPAAPPLPFTYLGKLKKDGEWVVFLAQQNQSYIGVAGDVLEDTYLIEQVSPPELVLRYLPLGETQTLSIGSGE